MDLRLALTDLSGNVRSFLDGWTDVWVTPKLNGAATAKVKLARGGGAAGELSVANRALQVFDASTPLFFGKVWEPLVISSDGHEINARDPLAEFLARRVREAVDYTADDAAVIVYARLAAQNAKRNTYLREGTGDVSVNRDRSVLPGALEKDLVEEMANAADGYFFRCVPVTDTAGVMGDLDILYPDAGVERPEVIFAYGTATLDNLDAFTITSYLPKNRQVASSSASSGGRIAEAAEDADSITEYGLFEDEATFSDVTDTTLLSDQAEGNVKASPPRTIEAKPGKGTDVPMLWDDFDIGDFVRVQIKDDGLNILEWARVIDATVHFDSNGHAELDGISFELLIGDAVTVPPHLLFRKQLDDTRRRLEALERRQQHVTETFVASPGEPTAGSGGGGGGPADPSAPPPPPPSTPGAPPVVGGVLALAASPYDIAVTVITDVPASVTVGASVGGSLVAIAGPAQSGGSITMNLGGLTPGVAYDISASATNANGTGYGSGGSVQTPVSGAG